MLNPTHSLTVACQQLKAVLSQVNRCAMQKSFSCEGVKICRNIHYPLHFYATFLCICYISATDSVCLPVSR